MWMRYRNGPIEFLMMLLVGAIILQIVVGMLIPLIPYLVTLLILAGVGYVGFRVWSRGSRW